MHRRNIRTSADVAVVLLIFFCPDADSEYLIFQVLLVPVPCKILVRFSYSSNKSLEESQCLLLIRPYKNAVSRPIFRVALICIVLLLPEILILALADVKFHSQELFVWNIFYLLYAYNVSAIWNSRKCPTCYFLYFVKIVDFFHAFIPLIFLLKILQSINYNSDVVRNFVYVECAARCFCRTVFCSCFKHILAVFIDS